MFETGTESFIILSTLLISVFILGTIIFFVVHQKRLISIENRQNLKLSEAIIESQENERRKIGDDLHEEIGPKLSAIKLYLRTYLKKTKSNDQSVLENVIQITDECVNIIRDLAHNLHPVALENSGLNDAVYDFCREMNKTEACRIEFNRNFELLEISTNKQLMLFRIIQELVLNAMSHGDADKFTISIDQDQSFLQVNIMNNGAKFDMPDYKKGLQNSKGLGLKNIQHRLNLLNGAISFFKNEQVNLYGVLLKIPLN